MKLELDISHEEYDTISKLYAKLKLYAKIKKSDVSNQLILLLSKILESVKTERFCERNVNIYRMHLEGHSYKEIGDLFDLTPSAVQRICWKQETIKNRLSHSADEVPFLECITIAAKELNMPNTRPTRVYNTLYRNGLIDFNENVKNLDEISDIKFLKMKSIGPKSLILIRRAYEIYKERNQQNV